MQFITLSKVPGESYRPNTFKIYQAKRNGVTVGTLEQAPRGWEVLNANFERVSVHTTIKAAVRVASRAL